MVSFVSGNKHDDDTNSLATQATKTLDEIPSSLPDPKVVNSMTAKEMNAMSVTARNNAYEDLHGVSPTIKEELNFVNESKSQLIATLQQQLATSSSLSTKKCAYEIALDQSPNYVHGNDLLLLFLRATQFDIKSSAFKMIQYFEFKQYYFGIESLGRPIYYHDLNPEDIFCLKCGWIQVLPFRDKAGRAIVWMIQSHQPKDQPAIAQIRSMWYFFFLLLKDEDTQKSGFVIVGNQTGSPDYLSGFFNRNSLTAFWHGIRFGTYAPIRIVSCHHCFDNSIVAPLVSLMELGADSTIRSRTRIHFGSQTEWMYALMTFGIPVEHAPLTSSGNIKLTYFKKWLTQKIKKEQETIIGRNNNHDTDNIIIDLPRSSDILLGSGSLQNGYPGNNLYQQIIYEYSDMYNNTRNRNEKTNITQQVYTILIKEQARFLERSNNNDKKETGWVQVTNVDTILSKIALQLRRCKKQQQEEEEQQQQDNDTVRVVVQQQRKESSTSKKKESGKQSSSPSLSLSLPPTTKSSSNNNFDYQQLIDNELSMTFIDNDNYNAGVACNNLLFCTPTTSSGPLPKQARF